MENPHLKIINVQIVKRVFLHNFCLDKDLKGVTGNAW